jgi:hypothetical protein
MTMPRLLLPAALVLLLTGCYTVDNERFAGTMHAMVKGGMPMADAVARLKAEGFACSAMLPMPSLTCSKTRQSIAPYTCVERVNLNAAPDPSRVGAVEVPKIACAGL